MGGGGGESKSKSYTTPSYPADVEGLRQSLIQPLTGQAMQESPFYSALSNMYQGVMNQATPGVSPQTNQSINNAMTTGLPMTTEAFMNAAQPYYQGAYPAYQSALDMALGQAKESSGMSGNTRGSAGYEALGRGASSTTADFLKYLTGQAAQSYEAAAGRQMGAIPMALQAELQPYTEAGMAATTAGQVGAAQYPMMLPAMQMATAGMGPAGYSTSSSQQAPQMSCCFIFIEGERLTTNVRRFRDSLFTKGGVVELGYRRMAKWLVPIMRRNWFVKEIVKATMLTPICSIADYHYGYNSSGWMFRPIGHFWRKVWETLGK